MKKLLLFFILSCLLLSSAMADWGGNLGTVGQKYKAITTATTTVIKTGFTFLGSMVVTGGTMGVVTVYASGTTVGAPIMATFSSTMTPNTYIFNTNVASGVTVVTGSATDITVTYL